MGVAPGVAKAGTMPRFAAAAQPADGREVDKFDTKRGFPMSAGAVAGSPPNLLN
jgi:hypothetical protein